MPWFRLKPLPVTSITLVILTYAVFGWSFAEDSIHWSKILEVNVDQLLWDVDQSTMLFLIHAFALFAITLITLALTAPITLMTYFVGTWLESEWESIISMVAWSFLFVIALRWFDHFTTFLVLLCAAILGRLELRYAGLGPNQALGMVTTICLTSFLGGALLFFYYHPLMHP